MDFGKLWCVDIGSSTITIVPLWGDVDDGGGYAFGHIGNLCTCLFNISVNFKLLLKINLKFYLKN